MRYFAGLCLLLIAAATRADSFEGWQAIRVIEQKGAPDRMIAADLDGDGRDQLVVVNPRQSRLDVYGWVPPPQRDERQVADARFPNELPLAPDWRREEISIDEIPSDVLAWDLTGDGQLELLVLAVAASSNKLFLYQKNDEGRWLLDSRWDLLPGRAAGSGALMLVRPLEDGPDELLISLDQGIQQLPLKKGSRPRWLLPRETRGRVDWRLLDLDGDGDLDLVEWSPLPQQSVRWYECVGGDLLPAQALHNKPIQGLASLQVPGGPAELLLLTTQPEGVLRRYRLEHGEPSAIGRQESLPMPGGAKAVWCGMRLDKEPALVALDSVQPRLRVHKLAASGWLAEESYPTVSGIRALAAPVARPGELLIWTKDAADLHLSRWESGRLTYPRVMPQSDDVADRRILALETVGEVTWWVQRVADDLDLYVWKAGEKKPHRTRFPGAGAKVEKVVWLGGERLLVQQAYASSARLLSLAEQDGKVALKSAEPAHLAKTDLAEYGIYARGDQLTPARLTDGVLQWLDDDLHPTDQVMLPDGARLAAFVPAADQQVWAQEQGATTFHRLEPDESGIYRVAESVRPTAGGALRYDAVLGLMLIDQDRVLRLSNGQPWELKLIDSIDSRVGRPSGVREATIHRVLSANVVSRDSDDVVLADDRRHQLTVLRRGDDELTPLLSWQVFEDESYPYGDSSADTVPEPRLVVGFDADGDGLRDLAMLCHDRLVIYLARESE